MKKIKYEVDFRHICNNYNIDCDDCPYDGSDSVFTNNQFCIIDNMIDFLIKIGVLRNVE